MSLGGRVEVFQIGMQRAHHLPRCRITKEDGEFGKHVGEIRGRLKM